MRRLILFRHAKSDWDAPFGSDHERPLKKRGIRAAKTMGLVLTRSALVPDHAITSSAVRARTTLELAKEAGGWDTTTEVSDALYGTSPAGALEVASHASGDVQSLMLVGHEPTWSALTYHLTGGAVTVKTATVVGIDLHVDNWSRLPAVSGNLAFVLQPRHFAEASWELTD
jgi:phosphohistidine phosphatase